MDKIASGYGVAVRQPEGGYSFHKLDDNSQVSASEIIKASSGNGNIVVNARGTFNGALFQASSLSARP